MNKKIISALLACLFLLLCSACKAEENQKRYDYDLSEYVQLDNYDKVKADFAPTGECTEEEIDNQVFQILLTYGDCVEKETQVVEEYDTVVVKYRIYHDGEEMTEYSDDEYEILVGYQGNGDVDAALAKEMLGKTVGDVCKITYTFPENDANLGSWAGETVECKGEIVSVWQTLIPECTDEMVSEIGEGFASVTAFREALRQDILEQKETAKADAVLAAFMDGVTVKKYPQAEVQAYIDRYFREISAAAEELGVSYEDYLKDYLSMTEDEITSAAKADAQDRVKKDMACIQASRLLNVDLSEEEYQEGLVRYYDGEKDLFDSKSDFEEYYTKDILWECIRWDKTFLLMLESAESAK
ncbi:MAG: hypothetical protein IKU24_06210 [Clostridia bacterium]|nr:hypothetical protein [Clostridia bacterium]